MSISGKAAVAGVMGWPVGHSRSPRLHGYWIARLGLDAAYIPLPVRPDDLPAALKALPALGLRGCNLTVPHKERALALVDHADPGARLIGAVNTVVVQADGSLRGLNTDAPGFLASLTGSAPGFALRGRTAVVIGAGGAARAVIHALLEAGAARLLLVNRSRDKADRLRAAFGPKLVVHDWGEREELLAQADLLVNTTSLGMEGQPPLDLRLDDLAVGALVTDIVYTPLETALLAAARVRGNPTVDGLGMLLHQAVEGFALWFGVRPRVDDALRAHVLAP